MSDRDFHRTRVAVGVTLLVMLVLFTLSIPGAWGAPITAPQYQAPAWQPNTSYAVGALATYNGVTYRCRQAHTSLVGWEPPIVPALWEVVGTVTPPPSTTVPPTTPPPATPTPTSPPGTCTAPAWSRTAVYVGGNVVSHVHAPDDGDHRRCRFAVAGGPFLSRAGIALHREVAGSSFNP